jgi:hypothetical protein
MRQEPRSENENKVNLQRRIKLISNDLILRKMAKDYLVKMGLIMNWVVKWLRVNRDI